MRRESGREQPHIVDPIRRAVAEAIPLVRIANVFIDVVERQSHHTILRENEEFRAARSTAVVLQDLIQLSFTDDLNTVEKESKLDGKGRTDVLFLTHGWLERRGGEAGAGADRIFADVQNPIAIPVRGSLSPWVLTGNLHACRIQDCSPVRGHSHNQGMEVEVALHFGIGGLGHIGRQPDH